MKLKSKAKYKPGYGRIFPLYILFLIFNQLADNYIVAGANTSTFSE